MRKADDRAQPAAAGYCCWLPLLTAAADFRVVALLGPVMHCRGRL